MSQGELAACIDTHLQMNGVKVVLSGGACVAVYRRDQYVSKDLDCIARFTLDHKKTESLMQEIGFEKTGSIFFPSRNKLVRQIHVRAARCWAGAHRQNPSNDPGNRATETPVPYGFGERPVGCFLPLERQAMPGASSACGEGPSS